MTPVARPDLTTVKDWFDWRKEACDAIDAVKGNFQPGTTIKVKDELYKRAMPFLLPLFHNKCAYCESLITNTHPGDVEHYRPKARIKGIVGKIVKINMGGQEIEHPGYWWLCYDWENLLPSCIDCNRRRNHADDEAMAAAGKADIFPILGKRAGGPNDPLAAEDALLLNPTESNFDPEVHFEFQPLDGRIKPKTERARISCDLLGLNLRESLVKQRSVAYSAAQKAMKALIGDMIGVLGAPAPMTDDEKQSRAEINDMWEGRTPHTAFARLALLSAKKALEQRNVKIELPLATS